MIRAKFRVSYVIESEGVVVLYPVYSGSEENDRFYDATPGGQIVMQTINKDALAQFKPGSEFYVDFTPAS